MLRTGKTDTMTSVHTEPLSIDQIIDKALALCKNLPAQHLQYTHSIEELKTRLSTGRLHCAVLGQFNRGKSTFINALSGMPVLPASVLPLTSVPTTIRYGTSNTCIIRFTNGQPDKILTGAPEGVKTLLSTFVTEENNPKNNLCVKEAIVECQSDLLRNGTILLDTPGFGSTYIHNTQTTIDLLSECDVAFFLLSAELPITEAEIEFLKAVRVYVPRIFFVFNKVDLLSLSEREQSIQFIQKEIQRGIGYIADFRLFSVCARIGQQAARQIESDPLWRQSGMEEVRKALSTFMAVDKYFALSHALNKKFVEALSAIIAALKETLKHLEDPLNADLSEMSMLGDAIALCMKQSETETEVISAERTALVDFADKTALSLRPKAQAELTTFLDDLIKTAAATNSTSIFNGKSFFGFCSQLVNNYYHSALALVNKPVRKAVVLHRASYMSLTQTTHQFLASSPDSVVNGDDITDAIELKPVELGLPESFEKAFAKNLSKFSDRFLSVNARYSSFKSRFEPELQAMSQTALDKAAQNLRNSVEEAVKALRRDVKRAYETLAVNLDAELHRRSELHSIAETQVRPAIENISKLLDGFNEVAALLTPEK